MYKYIIIMATFKYISGFVFLTVVGMIYKKWKKTEQHWDEEKYYDIVKKYLLDSKPLSNKPIVWIYIDYEKNSRKWINFGSRTSRDLNKPYLYITIKSIIDKCKKDFNVHIINDNSFEKLLPNWNIDLSKVSNPIKSKLQTIAKLKVLYNYGGFVVPPNYLALHNLKELYDIGRKKHTTFNVDNNIHFISSDPNCSIIHSIIQTLEYNIHNTNFNNTIIPCSNNVSGGLIGKYDTDNNPIYIDDLLSTHDIQFNKSLNGILIPSNDINKLTKYSWFNYININEILKSDIILSKYMNLCF